MTTKTVHTEARGTWSLATSTAFWEGFAPSALPAGSGDDLSTVFLVEADRSRGEATVAQDGGTAMIAVSGDGDLDAAAARDPVTDEVQEEFAGLRSRGFRSPYEAAVSVVLSQRIRVAGGDAAGRRPARGPRRDPGSRRADEAERSGPAVEPIEDEDRHRQRRRQQQDPDAEEERQEHPVHRLERERDREAGDAREQQHDADDGTHDVIHGCIISHPGASRQVTDRYRAEA